MDDIQSNPMLSDTDQLHLQGPEAVPYRLDIAGIGARSYAFVIDWHIRLLLTLSWFLGVGLLFNSWDELRNMVWNEADDSMTMLMGIPSLIIYFLYHPILEVAMTGRTPGKRMAGVRIVTSEGLTPSVGAILLRNIFRLLDSLPSLYFLGLVVCACTRHRVRIGDIAAGLLLVYDHQVDDKQMDIITNMAINSRLSHQDQALLLDLLARWQKIEADQRIRLAEKFLQHIGEPVKASSAKPALRITELHQQLQKLTETGSSDENGE